VILARLACHRGSSLPAVGIAAAPGPTPIRLAKTTGRIIGFRLISRNRCRMPRASLKESLLAAALDQFHARGYNATGVASIATAAGAPKGSFYNHFSSKEDLAIQVVNAYARSMKPELLQADGAEPVARIRRHFAHLASSLEEFDYRRGCLLGNMAAETGETSNDVGSRVNTIFEDWAADLSAAVKDAQSEGTVPDELDADLAAAALIDLYEGAALLAKATGRSESVRRALEHGIPALLHLNR